MPEDPLRPMSFRLPATIAEGIASASNERDIAQVEFVVEALREKFDRIKSGKDEGWGPLSGLDDVDRGRVMKFVDCLRIAPKDRGFRRAVDANFSWLMETVSRAVQPRKH